MSSIFSDVLHVLQGIPELRRVPRAKLQVFAVEVSLVALGVRTAFLFDTFAVSGTIRERINLFSTILVKLRKTTPEFAQVVALNETNTHDTFFVNTTVLQERFWDARELGGFVTEPGPPEQDHGVDRATTFVSVSSSEHDPEILSSPPERVIHIVHSLHTALGLSLSSSHEHEHTHDALPLHINLPQALTGDTAESMVPLAALLLEYPVAYVPEPLPTEGYLAGVELLVVSCALKFSTTGTQEEWLPEQHRFMQFSCPVALAPDGIVQRLQEKFGRRIEDAGLECTLEVTSRTERLDRVAL